MSAYLCFQYNLKINEQRHPEGRAHRMSYLSHSKNQKVNWCIFVRTAIFKLIMLECRIRQIALTFIIGILDFLKRKPSFKMLVITSLSQHHFSSMAPLWDTTVFCHKTINNFIAQVKRPQKPGQKKRIWLAAEFVHVWLQTAGRPGRGAG